MMVSEYLMRRLFDVGSKFVRSVNRGVRNGAFHQIRVSARGDGVSYL
jgi:hypothetical protein